MTVKVLLRVTFESYFCGGSGIDSDIMVVTMKVTLKVAPILTLTDIGSDNSHSIDSYDNLEMTLAISNYTDYGN